MGRAAPAAALAAVLGVLPAPATANPAVPAAAARALRVADAVRDAAARGLAPLLAEAAALRPGAVFEGPPPGAGGLPALLRAIRLARAEVAAAARRSSVARVPHPAGRMPSRLPVDVDRVVRAALRLSAALDASLPSLPALPAAPRLPGEGCDVLDQLPRLCVGGAGDNTYDRDAALTIDLGGDDRYLSSAGGANANICGLGTVDPERPWCQVSAAVDLSGDDTYASSAEGRRDSAGQVAVVGAGLAAVGMLVDLEGNDTYAPTADPEPTLFGEGAGAFGVGMLADLAGDDRYFLGGEAFDVENAFGGGPGVNGQGSGGIGVGVLHDAGGNDSYELRLDPGRGGTVATQGQGYGVIGGAGVLVDSGGTDAPRASVAGMGGGAHGALVDRGRLDDYVAVARGRAETFPDPSRAIDLSSTAVVLGAFGGAHADVDAGERDTYVVDPERGVLAGRRGEDQMWVEAGVAANGSLAPKTPTTMSIFSATPPDEAGILRAEVLLASGGAPLEGREVVLEVEEVGPLSSYPLEGAAHAITGPDGRAVLLLNLPFALRHQIATNPHLLVARYSGDRAYAWSRATLALA